MISDQGSCTNLRTMAETPATSYHDKTLSLQDEHIPKTPLRLNRSRNSNVYDRSPSFVTASRGRTPKIDGQRYSFALGEGKFLLLEELVDKSRN